MDVLARRFTCLHRLIQRLTQLGLAQHNSKIQDHTEEEYSYTNLKYPLNSTAWDQDALRSKLIAHAVPSCRINRFHDRPQSSSSSILCPGQPGLGK